MSITAPPLGSIRMAAPVNTAGGVVRHGDGPHDIHIAPVYEGPSFPPYMSVQGMAPGFLGHVTAHAPASGYAQC